MPERYWQSVYKFQIFGLEDDVDGGAILMYLLDNFLSSYSETGPALGTGNTAEVRTAA